MSTHIRQLPFEEWDKLDGLPIATNGLPNPETSMILAAEDENGIVVGVWAAMTPIVLEGLWIREDHRNSTVAGRLLQRMKLFLNSIQVDRAFTLVQSADVKSLAEKAGFAVIPGDLMMLDLLDLEKDS